MLRTKSRQRASSQEADSASTTASLVNVPVAVCVLYATWTTTLLVVIQDKNIPPWERNTQQRAGEENEPQLDQEKRHSQEGVQALRREGFTEEEIKRLSQLRSIQAELGVFLTAAEYQRWAFVRWLVATGKWSDELA